MATFYAAFPIMIGLTVTFGKSYQKSFKLWLNFDADQNKYIHEVSANQCSPLVNILKSGP